MAIKFEFSDNYIYRLYEKAKPKNHYTAFAWREGAETLDKAWKRKTAKYSDKQKDDFIKMMVLAADAQEKDRIARQKAGEKLHRPKGVAVWFNAGSWADEIASTQEAHKASLITCLWCPSEVKRRFTLCPNCEKKYRARNRKEVADGLEKMGLYQPGDTLEQLNAKCKKAFPTLMKRFKERSLK